MERGALLYEGKAKQVYATDDPNLVIIHYKDSATAFNGVKKAEIDGKGVVNARITSHIFGLLQERGVRTHFVQALSETDHLCRKVEIIPVEVVIRNVAAGSLVRRYGLQDGLVLDTPMVELFVKSDELNDPLCTEDHAIRFGWARKWELEAMYEQALTINAFLQEFWGELGLTLVDFKLEFGRDDGRVVLADEITPDGSRLWDKVTGQPMDKDVFRKDLGDLSETYQRLSERIFSA